MPADFKDQRHICPFRFPASLESCKEEVACAGSGLEVDAKERHAALFHFVWCLCYSRFSFFEFTFEQEEVLP